MSTRKEIQEELEEIGSVLARIPRTNPYSPPPDGYFEQLTATMLQEVRQAKLVPLVARRSVWRMAAAAAIAGFLVLGGWLYLEKHSPGTNEVVADASILPTLQKNIQQVSDSEMVNYVEGNDIVDPDEVSSTVPIKEEDLNLVFADVSDQELQQYLDQQNVSVKLN